MNQLIPGTRLGNYEVIGLLGKGGMGEVYSASDTKLGRNVAIKVLPEVFTHDPDRVNRFKREAKVLAALNHPNIAVIHGLEESGDQQFLVMELVEGETLADKLACGALPIDEAPRIAIQIAEGLEAAHEKGIVHRDLKPANVKITPDGRVKLLDFGLAKAFEPDLSRPLLSNSPTLTGAATNAGVILGTAGYMSPEQAKGFASDQRGDVFSFGCVLYEMLTGKPAFEGETISEIMASVLKSEPDFDRLPGSVDPRFRKLLQRTLAKNPKRRFHAIADVRFEIEDVLSEPPVVAASEKPVRNPRLAWIVAAVATLALASIALTHFREKPPTEQPEMRLEIATPQTPSPLEFALSPDGRYIAFIAADNGPQRLWLRALDKTEAQPIPGTEAAGNPFWSPDSRSIGFTATGKLKRIDIAGGPPQVLANTSTLRTGTWNQDGTILFNATLGPLSRVASSGGEPVAVTRLDPPRQVAHVIPHFLPDGRHFLFYTIGTPEASGIYLGSLDGGEPKRLTAADTAAEYLAPGMDGRYLLYAESDLKTGRDLWVLPITGNDRKPIVVLKTPFDESNGQFSPDGRWIAYETNESGRFEIVVQSFPEPFGKWQVSTGGGIQPRWGADSKQLYFISPEGKMMAASITASPQTLVVGPPVALFSVLLAPGAGTNKQQYAVSRDGRFLINQPAETSAMPPITVILNWKMKP